MEATNASSAQRKKSEERGNDLQLNQLTLWFINARRRSGWSSILRKFARNDRQRMSLLMQAKMDACNISTITNDPRHPCSQRGRRASRQPRKAHDADKKEFEDDWTSMISWLKYGVKEKVGDWVYDIVANSKKPLKAGQPRTVTTAANRTPVRKTAAPSRPKRATRRISKTPSVDSDIQSEHESTPELSMCTTADTASALSAATSRCCSTIHSRRHTRRFSARRSRQLRRGRSKRSLSVLRNQTPQVSD